LIIVNDSNGILSFFVNRMDEEFAYWADFNALYRGPIGTSKLMVSLASCLRDDGEAYLVVVEAEPGHFSDQVERTGQLDEFVYVSDGGFEAHLCELVVVGWEHRGTKSSSYASRELEFLTRQRNCKIERTLGDYQLEWKMFI
jgi:hypothetical protein